MQTQAFKFISTLLLLIVMGCASKIALVDHRSTFHQQKRDNPQTGVKLSVFKTGHMQVREALLFSGGRWGHKRSGSHPAILVQHPKGNILFDTGLGNKVDEQFEQGMPFIPKLMTAYERDRSMHAFLTAELNNLPIASVFFSHLHWDHASGIPDLPEPQLWTTRAEHAWALSGKAPDGAYLMSQLQGTEGRWHYINFVDQPYENFDQHFDVYGDGSMVIVPLPGHSPGGIAMFVNLDSGTRVLFTGDTTWMQEGFTLPAHKNSMVSMMADHDKSQLQQSILKIHSLMQQYPQLRVIPSHDDDAISTLGYWPSVHQ